MGLIRYLSRRRFFLPAPLFPVMVLARSRFLLLRVYLFRRSSTLDESAELLRGGEKPTIEPQLLGDCVYVPRSRCSAAFVNLSSTALLMRLPTMPSFTQQDTGLFQPTRQPTPDKRLWTTRESIHHCSNFSTTRSPTPLSLFSE